MRTRTETEASLREKRIPVFAKAASRLREQSVAELQHWLIASDTHFVVVLERKEGDVIELVTLHELLCAESAMAQKVKEED